MPYNWTVQQDLSYGSDHHVIQWTLFYNAQSINNLTGQHYNTKDTDIKEWTKTLEANLNTSIIHHYTFYWTKTRPSQQRN